MTTEQKVGVTIFTVSLMTLILSPIVKSSDQLERIDLVDFSGIADVVENLMSFGSNSELNIISDFELPAVQSNFLTNLAGRGSTSDL